jgi:hypothetical protein
MITPIHDVPQSFVSRTIFTTPHLQSLADIFTISSGADFLHFSGPYDGSRKQPDVFVRTKDFYWPTLVVETGWSEDYDDLIEDAKLWLLGSRGGSPGGAVASQHPVNTVIIIFFERKTFPADKLSIKGYLEVWRCDPANTDVIKQYLSMVSNLDSCHIRATSDFSS